MEQARGPQLPAWLDPAMVPNPSPDHPLSTRVYPTIESLEQDLHQFAKESGFAVSVRRSKKFTEGPQKGGLKSKTYYCDRGRLRPSTAKSRKTHSTKAADCGWSATASATKANNYQWSFQLKGVHHTGHGASEESTDHQRYRGLTKEMADYVSELSAQNPGIQSREVDRLVRQKYPSATFTSRDLENLRARQMKQRQEGYTPIQAVIKSFDDKGIKYSVRYAEEDPDRVIGLLWTLPWCETQWKRFSTCVQMDNTYNTNRQKMPLFHVTGMTHTNQAFCV